MSSPVMSIQVMTSDGYDITLSIDARKHQVHISGFGLDRTPILATTVQVLALRDALNLVYGP